MLRKYAPNNLGTVFTYESATPFAVPKPSTARDRFNRLVGAFMLRHTASQSEIFARRQIAKA